MTGRRPREVAALDLIRFAAAQAVMVYHLVFLSWTEPVRSHGIRAVVTGVAGVPPAAFPQAVGWSSLGWVGVQVFFVISGFVILMSAENKSAAEFLIGRVSRIMPALWVFSLLSAAVLLVAGTLAPAAVGVRLLRSMVLFPVGPWVDGAVWTLVAEAVFYTGVYVMIRTGTIARITTVMAVATLFNLLLWSTVVAGDIGLLGDAGHRLAGWASSYRLRVTLVSTNCYFVVGAALFQLFRRRDISASAAILIANVAAGLVATHFAARSSIGVAEFGESALAAPAVWGAATLVMAVCVLLRAGRGAGFAKAATVAGLLTYPLYLINQIVGGFLLGLASRAGLAPGVAVAGTAIACTLIAALFALGIERRMQRRLTAGLRRLGQMRQPALQEA